MPLETTRQSLSDISHSHSFAQLANLSDSLIQQLFEVAKLSIVAPQQQRIILEQHFSEFVQSNTFDSLHGGLLIPVGDETSRHFFKPIHLNIIIASLLLQADRVFYQGGFSEVGQLIVKHLLEILDTSDSGLLDSEFSAKFCELDCFISKEVFIGKLSLKEQQLFLALTNSDSNSSLITETEQFPTKGQLYGYRRNLNDASQMIAMEPKEAQIIEHSLHHKLNKKRQHTTPQHLPIEYIFETNCALLKLISLIQRIPNISGKHLNFRKLDSQAAHLFSSLVEYKANHPLSSANQLCFLDTGFSLLQSDFDLEKLSQLNTTLDWFLSRVHDDTLVIQHQCYIESQKLAVATSIKGLINSELLDRKYLTLSKVFEAGIDTRPTKIAGKKPNQTPMATFEAIILNKDHVDLDNQLTVLNAQFNPYQLVYKI